VSKKLSSPASSGTLEAEMVWIANCRKVLRALLPAAALALAAGVASPDARAAVVLTGPGSVTQNFNTFDGTAATLPAGVVVGGTTTFNGILTSGTGTYNGANGFYALNDDGSPADRAIGARAPAGSAYTITLAVTNNTGATIPGINIGYDVEQYTNGDPGTAGSTLTLTRSTDGTTFNSTGLSGNLSTTAQATQADQVFADPLVTPRTATYTGAVANGASVQFQFTFNPAGSGPRPHFGIDNFTASVVPEPAGLALLAGLVPFLTCRRRRGA
jgi:hypothetical protein